MDVTCRKNVPMSRVGGLSIQLLVDSNTIIFLLRYVFDTPYEMALDCNIEKAGLCCYYFIIWVLNEAKLSNLEKNIPGAFCAGIFEKFHRSILWYMKFIDGDTGQDSMLR